MTAVKNYFGSLILVFASNGRFNFIKALYIVHLSIRLRKLENGQKRGRGMVLFIMAKSTRLRVLFLSIDQYVGFPVYKDAALPFLGFLEVIPLHVYNFNSHLI